MYPYCVSLGIHLFFTGGNRLHIYMADLILAGKTMVNYMGRELELEHSLESTTGFLTIRQVRSNKDGEQFQSKFYVKGEGHRTLRQCVSAVEAATLYAAYKAGFISLPPKGLSKAKCRKTAVCLPLLPRSCIAPASSLPRGAGGQRGQGAARG